MIRLDGENVGSRSRRGYVRGSRGQRAKNGGRRSIREARERHIRVLEQILALVNVCLHRAADIELRDKMEDTTGVRERQTERRCQDATSQHSAVAATAKQSQMLIVCLHYRSSAAYFQYDTS